MTEGKKHNEREDESPDTEEREETLEHPEAGDVQCEQCEEYKLGWKRALADYQNLKRNLAKEKGDMRMRIKRGFVEELLPVLDNFDQAVKFQPEGLDGNAKGWLTGILHVQKQLENVLNEMGAQPFGQAGDTFDPNRHDAADEKQLEDEPDQVVLEVVQRGWQMDDKVIRPAKVIINNLED
jgi:molecular chaperone GrpE